MTREAVIVAATRTAVGRSKKGTTRNWRSDDMAAAVIKDLMAKAEALRPEDIDDVIIGDGINANNRLTTKACMEIPFVKNHLLVKSYLREPQRSWNHKPGAWQELFGINDSDNKCRFVIVTQWLKPLAVSRSRCQTPGFLLLHSKLLCLFRQCRHLR